MLALLALATVTTLFGGGVSALYVIFALRFLHLTAVMLGATVALGGLASLAGAATAGWIIRRLGLGPATILTGLVAALGAVFIPAAAGGRIAGMLMLMAAQLVGDSAGTITEIASRSMRQIRVAPEIMGRVGGVFALALGLAEVMGAVAGGWLGAVLGVRAGLWIAVGGVAAAQMVGLVSPVMQAGAPADQAAGGASIDT